MAVRLGVIVKISQTTEKLCGAVEEVGYLRVYLAVSVVPSAEHTASDGPRNGRHTRAVMFLLGLPTASQTLALDSRPAHENSRQNQLLSETVPADRRPTRQQGLADSRCIAEEHRLGEEAGADKVQVAWIADYISNVIMYCLYKCVLVRGREVHLYEIRGRDNFRTQQQAEGISTPPATSWCQTNQQAP
ncbi:hypothetical protein J6590_007311 [Homalodisca vitripennis]|nr:hypothetical protein J6590_007311 [Homalodisca vitripennis]